MRRTPSLRIQVRTLKQRTAWMKYNDRVSSPFVWSEKSERSMLIQSCWYAHTSKIALVVLTIQTESREWWDSLNHSILSCKHTHLDVRVTQITDSGAQHLAEALKLNKVKFIIILNEVFWCWCSCFYRNYSSYISTIIATSLLVWKRDWNNKTDECYLIDHFSLLFACNTIKFAWIDSTISAYVVGKQIANERVNLKAPQEPIDSSSRSLYQALFASVEMNENILLQDPTAYE
jgi:hypothetical protein